jgi:hypothetical protein
LPSRAARALRPGSAAGPFEGPKQGTSVTIKGENLRQATGVDFGSVAAASFAVGTGTRPLCAVVATSPPGTGLMDVTVTSPGGTSATGPQDHFSYQ